MDANLEAGLKANREFKDTVFSMLIEDRPGNAIDVSNTFLGTSYGPHDEAADGGLTDLELTVKMYNINRGRNEKILKSCAAIHEYSIFINMVREYKNSMTLEEAITKAVVDCIDQNVLKEFLLKHKGEVINMLISEWNMDIALEVRGEERAMEKTMEIAKKLKELGRPVDEIVLATGLTVDDILRL